MSGGTRRHRNKEPVLGNIVRRIMALVREEATREAREEAATASNAMLTSAGAAATGGAGSSGGGRSSLQSMLWALPQNVKTPSVRGRSTSFGAGGDHALQESFKKEEQQEQSLHGQQRRALVEFPVSYYEPRPGLKQAVMEAIQETVADLEDVHRNIHEQASNHIQPGDIVLTCGRSKTLELFLKAAASAMKKKQNSNQPTRTFQVLVVCEAGVGGGNEAADDHRRRREGLDMARSLRQSPGIEAIVVSDAAMFAVMARVDKVLLPAHAVLANGGLVAHSGCNGMALAAHYHSVPVLCVTGLYKLTPMFPYDGQDTLNDLISPTQEILTDRTDPLLEDVEFVNPIHDYIKPEHISL